MPRYRVKFCLTYPVYGKDEKEGLQAAEELFIEELRKRGVSPIYAMRGLLNYEIEDLGDSEDIQTIEDLETVKKMLKDKEKK